MNYNILLLFTVLGAFIVAGRLIYKKQVEGRRKIEERGDVAIPDIFEEFRSNTSLSLDQFQRLWTEIAECLELPPTKLRPTDRFDHELSWLSGYWGQVDGLSDLHDWTKNALIRQNQDPNEFNFSDLRQLVSSVSQAEGKQTSR